MGSIQKKVTLKKSLLCALFLPLLLACGKKAGDGEKMYELESKEEVVEKGGRSTSADQVEESADAAKEKAGEKPKERRKLVREGSLKYEVESLQEEEERIESILKELDGYVADQKLSREYSRKVVETTLRVPAENFKSLVERISTGVDGLDDKKIEVKDVTRAFIDMRARLDTKKGLEKRYKELLNRTDSVDEILRIEKEIQTLREDIERIEGRLRHLKDRISLSTLKLEYYQAIEQEEEESVAFHFWKKITEAARAGWRGVQWFLIVLTAFWPLLLLGGIGAFLGIRVYKARKARKDRGTS